MQHRATRGASPDGWVTFRGDPFSLGVAAGRYGRRAVHAKLLGSTQWQIATDKKHDAALARLLAATKRLHPALLEELRGLAEGLELPFREVFAWNCRGDLLASTDDGCTTVQLPGAPACLAHNEDGLPEFDGDMFLARLIPDREPALMACCYPGSLPGHTFALTRHGIVQTVNNLRLTAVRPEIPRMVLSRALLGQPTIEAALALLREAPASGGFHFSLAQPGDTYIHSIEIGAGEISHRALTRPALHANHALHHRWGRNHQIVTPSSCARQRRGDALLAAGEHDPLTILGDSGDGGLPILRREPDDPDDENTLATAVFHLDAEDVSWQVRFPGRSQAISGTLSGLFGDPGLGPGSA
ncbi:C45 family autoproteolytic acyltransferase/hydolase [Billgrantia saliphila]|uniref:C45 family autoproteolytic acyltransferase/hydolase n=1 Tax=Billgrantia saliphila TaxID=1848458 RepID=UPI000CE45287|nr:C45 family peptidase [Halomonas saliphila]